MPHCRRHPERAAASARRSRGDLLMSSATPDAPPRPRPASPRRCSGGSRSPGRRRSRPDRASGCPGRCGVRDRWPARPRSAPANEIFSGPHRPAPLCTADVGLAEEARDERRRRPLVGLVRRADLLGAALVHHHDAVGQRHRLGLVVRHQDRRGADACAGSGAARSASPRAAWRRDWRAARRAAGCCGRMTSARASATRCCWPPDSWRGKRSAKAARPDQLQRLADAPASRSAAATPCISRPKATFSADRHVREQRVALEHDAEPALGRLHRQEVAALEA